MTQSERRDKNKELVLSLLQRDYIIGFSVPEIVPLLGLSDSTVRRCLKSLQEEGKVFVKTFEMNYYYYKGEEKL